MANRPIAAGPPLERRNWPRRAFLSVVCMFAPFGLCASPTRASLFAIRPNAQNGFGRPERTAHGLPSTTAHKPPATPAIELAPVPLEAARARLIASALSQESGAENGSRPPAAKRLLRSSQFRRRRDRAVRRCCPPSVGATQCCTVAYSPENACRSRTGQPHEPRISPRTASLDRVRKGSSCGRSLPGSCTALVRHRRRSGGSTAGSGCSAFAPRLGLRAALQLAPTRCDSTVVVHLPLPMRPRGYRGCWRRHRWRRRVVGGSGASVSSSQTPRSLRCS